MTAVGVRFLLSIAALCLATASPASAQSRSAGAESLRAQGREAVQQGQLAEAYALLREAAAQADDPTAWRELAEVAERLRLDAAAIDAYRRYLAGAGDAVEDRAEIEGRLRVLQHHLDGGRYAAVEDGRLVAVIEPAGRDDAETGQDILVDWEGRPQRRAPTPLLALADWEGSIEPPAPPTASELTPRGDGVGLGRALDAP